MKRSKLVRGILFCGLLAGLLVPTLQGGDWTQFRGPGGTGASDDTNLPVEWSTTKNIRWKADLPGKGLSSAVIAGDRVYVTTCSGPEEKRLHVLCFDPKTGKKLWERQFWATGKTQCHPKTNMAAPTPVTDGKRVFALFATADVAALDRDGNLLWYRSLASDYPTIGNNVGMAASPALYKDILFVPMENVGDSFVAALDAKTGKNLWKKQRSQKINWTSPIVVERAGKTEVLFQSGDVLTAYEPETGKELWSFKGELSTIPSPTAGDGLVFAPGGSLVAVKPGKEAKAVWDSNKLKSSYTSPVLYKGKLYTVNSVGIVTCTDPQTGNPIWQSPRTKGPYAATPVAAEDRLYLVNEAGQTFVLQLGDEPKIIATNPIEDTILATPSIAGGAIFLRSDKHLYCIGKNE
ncbi:MAG: PQQ-binding-like beta-propeller repeat protein [Gemmataceae bacterium]